MNVSYLDLKRIFLVILFLCQNSIFSQTYQMDDVHNGGVPITTCSGTFYDSRVGTSDYFNNENYTATFCSGSPGEVLKFIVNPDETSYGYAIADAGDILTVYDGTGTTGTVLGTYSSGDDPGSNSFVIQGISECITFQWISDAAGDSDGWRMEIECVPAGCGSNPDPADNFADAPYVCNLDGFCSTTKGYTDDEPFNFVGGGNCPVIFGGTIENNSWLVFEATGTNISFDIDVIGCYGAFGYDPTPSSATYGIQAAILAYDGVSTLTRVSNCAVSDGSQLSFTLSNTTPLVSGDTYYLVVDGSAGSICDYSINVSGDVATVNAGADQEICPGDDLDLTAIGPAGATYVWNALDGSVVNDVGQTQTYNPTIETVYVVEVTSGLCVNQKDTVRATMCSNLPVDLVSFDVMCYDNTKLINWTTDSEINNSHFLIEKSTNGHDFYQIGLIDGQINSSKKTNYSIFDHESAGLISYYRLIQVDLDGKRTYSRVINSKSDCKDDLVNKPYYNSQNNEIVFTNIKGKPVEANYKFIDMSGRIVMTEKVELIQGRNYISVDNEIKGIYIIILETSSGVVKSKIKL